MAGTASTATHRNGAARYCSSHGSIMNSPATLSFCSFNAKFFNAATNQYASGSQCANAMALVMGLVNPAHHVAVLSTHTGVKFVKVEDDFTIFEITAAGTYTFTMEPYPRTSHSDC